MPKLRFASALLLLAAASQPLAAQATPPTSAFIVRLGTDTIAVERVRRTGDALSIEQVLRSPRTSLRHTHVELTPARDLSRLHLMFHPIGQPMDAPLVGSTRLSMRGADSATIEITQGDSTRSRTVAARAGMIPSLAQSFFPYELAAIRARAGGSDSLTVTLLSAGGDTMPVVVRRVGADSMTFRLPFLTYRARVDGEGRLLGLAQPLGVAVERLYDVDIDRIARAWADLDSRGRAMGPLSPLDSLSARVGAARVRIRYSRPRTRGRVVFGRIVPWDSVWRTGANAATVLTTDRDLLVRNVRVPAGSYSIFTIPSRNGTTLIINRQTMRDGEPLAGTDYDASQDLARIPMTTRRLGPAVPQFTISVVPRGGSRADLRFRWDRREMFVPVRAR